VDDNVERLLRAAAQIEARSGVRTCLIGGLARGVWATRRATADVDVIVDIEDLAPILALGPQLGLVTVQREIDALKPSAMARLRLPEELTGDTRLDVIARSHDYYVRVLARAVEVAVLGVPMRVACAEDIVVLKTLADRPQDRADVAAIIEAQRDKLDRALIARECAALEIEVPAALR
jgi:predicted nucleotidyltransferase